MCPLPGAPIDSGLWYQNQEMGPGPPGLAEVSLVLPAFVCVFLCSLVTGVGFCNHQIQDTKYCQHTFPSCHPLWLFTH